MMSVAKIATGGSLAGPITYFLGNTKMFCVVFYGLLEVTKGLIIIAKIAICTYISIRRCQNCYR